MVVFGMTIRVSYLAEIVLCTDSSCQTIQLCVVQTAAKALFAHGGIWDDHSCLLLSRDCVVH